MNKLLRHFINMQAAATRFLEPGEYKTIHGKIVDHPLGQHSEFANDMIYMLDGPEQREAQTHAEFNYLGESARTVSDKFYGELVGYKELRAALIEFGACAAKLDRIKKLLYYGEDIKKNRVRNGNPDRTVHEFMGNLMRSVSLPNDETSYGSEAHKRAIDVVHAILGIATEAGEMVEALAEVFAGKNLDLVNLGEESGDVKWYLAILARVRNVDWDDDERVNIAKLRMRFPQKFTEQHANERDLTAERNVLEGKVVKPDGTREIVVNADTCFKSATDTVGSN